MIDRFADSYVAGETPVPCIECNQSIKFRDLLDTARELGAEVLATGHYVASRALPGRRPRALPRRRRRARPELFPVRHHARAARLPALSARRPDQGGDARARAPASACRSPTSTTARTSASCRPGRYTDVIERLKPGAAEPGDIVDLDGRVLGRHHGIIHFTVGQRRGLGIAAGEPLYVVRLDAATRRVVVGPREALRTRRMRLRDVNWLGDGALDQALGAGRREMFVKVRSTRPPQPAWLTRQRRRASRSNWSPARTACRPGQACVFYDAADGPGARARRRLHPERSAAPIDATAARHRRMPRRLASAGRRRGSDVRGGYGRQCMGDDLDNGTVAKAYARWAPIYDLVFGAVFDARPQGVDRGRRAHRRAHPRCRRRHRHFAARTIRATNRIVGVDYLRADAAQGA